MTLLITGARGMLGRTLMKRFFDRQPVGVDLADFDLADAAATLREVTAISPSVVLHAAAMTDVDGCESDSDAALRANAVGSANLARACQNCGARCIVISTDYVFAGDSDRPYHEWDVPAPTTIYGQSKLAGELAVRELCPDHLIVRIGWLYGAGGPSFFHTMVRLARETGDLVRVVQDQLGTPTSCDAVADHLAMLLEQPIAGTLHLTCEGETSWYGFAEAIWRQTHSSRALTACSSSEFPRPAPRPANSRLENRALRLHGLPPMPAWEDALARFFREHPDG